jgi:hypothetical protein
MAEHTHRWRARPVATWGVKAFILLVPVAAGTAVGLALAARVPAPTALGARIGWSMLVLGTSTLVLLAVERVVRRLAPLALLLRLSLVFPDEAPKRFGVALRAVRPRREEADGARAEAEASLALLARLLTHDRRTRGHSERVAAYATMIAQELGVDEEERARLTWGALLHDIGKLEVPASILNKPGSLDDAEWKVLSAHPLAGRALVAPLRPWLGDALSAVDGHHERFDGGGYPEHRPAGDLPLAARVTAVADAFETMTAARSYKDPMPIGAARSEVAACAGGHFDPQVCRAFLALSVPRLWRVAGPMAWLAQVPLVGLLVRGELVPVALGSAAQGAAAATGQALTAAAVMGGALVAGGVAGQAVDTPTAVPAAVAQDLVGDGSGAHQGPVTTDSSGAPTSSTDEGGASTDRAGATPSSRSTPDDAGPSEPDPTTTTTTVPADAPPTTVADDGADAGSSDDHANSGGNGGGNSGSGNSGSNGGGNSGSGNSGSNSGGNSGGNSGSNSGGNGGGNSGSNSGGNGGGNSGSGGGSNSGGNGGGNGNGNSGSGHGGGSDHDETAAA